MKKVVYIALFLIPLTTQSQNTFDSLFHAYDLQVYFETDIHSLNMEAKLALDSLLANYSSMECSFEVKAHTDDIGSDEYNQTLSKNRAESIREYLLEKEIASEWINLSFFGESVPKTTNDSEEGRRVNRRATVKVFEVKKLQWLTGTVKDEETGAGLSAHIKLHSKNFESETSSDTSGYFRIAAPPNEVVGLDIRSKGFLLETKMLKVKPLMSTKPVDLPMPRIEVGKKFSLDRLFFMGNRDVLRPKSEAIFEQLLIFMQDNPGVCVEIGGHINLPNTKKVARDTWHMQLSIARAKKVHDLLIADAIDKDRILFKGYANWHMVFPKTTVEYQAAKNRRVEIKIIECDIAKSEEDDIVREGLDFSTGERQLLKNNIN